MKDIISRQEKLDIPYPVKVNNHLDYKEVDMTKRTVDLIANTYWWFDTDMDVLVPGVAAKSIQDRGPQSKMPGKIKHADAHDLRKIVAIPKLLEETTIQGLDVLHANSFFPETTISDNKLIEYQNEMIDQHSIGFRYLNLQFVEAEADEWDEILAKLINPDDAVEKGFLWLVKEIELFEYSNVAFGANRLTPYLGSKSENKNVRYNNLVSKLDHLHQLMRSGSGDKDIIKLEERQINQMIYELYNPEPDPKSTALEQPPKGATFDLDSAIENFNIN